MITGIAFLIIVAAVRLRGGDIGALATIRPRHVWTVLFAIVLQIVIISMFADRLPFAIASALHLASYGFAIAFVWLNRRIAGIVLTVAGGLLNLVAIVANGGVMPATAAALQFAGKAVNTGEFENSTVQADAKLGFLGDVFAFPNGMPFANVFSVGDILLVVGAYVMVSRACARTKPGGVSTRSDAAERSASAARVAALGDVARSLRAPLDAAMNHALTLAADDLNPAQAGAVASIVGAGEHIDATIAGLLDKASIEADMVALDIIEASVHDVVTEAVESLAPLAESRSVHVRHVGRPTELVRADAVRLRQVVRDLVSIAICHNRQPGAVSVIHEVVGERTVITIVDTGPGMSADEIDRLFVTEPHNPDETHAISGVPSLAVTSKLVRLMDGDLRVQSMLGVGTTYTLQLPAILLSRDASR